MKENRRLKKRIFHTIIMLFVFSVLWIGTVQASDSSTQKGRVIRVGYFDSDGFLFRNSDGTYYGYGAEYLERIAMETGWQYEYVSGEWNEMKREMEAGNIDFLAPVQSNNNRRLEMEFGRYSIGQEYSLLYVRADNQDVYYDDYQHMNGLRIGVVNGWQQQKTLRSMAKKKDIQYDEILYATETEVVWALRSGEIDAAMLSSENYSSEFKLVGRWDVNPAFFVTSHKNKALMEELDEAIMQILVKEPQFQNVLFEKYYNSSEGRVWPEFTREEAEYIQNAGEIPVMVVADRHAWFTVDEEGKENGIIPDILCKIQEMSGLKMKFIHEGYADNPVEKLDGDEIILAGNVLLSRNPEKRADRVYTDNYVTGYFAAVGKDVFRKSLSENLSVAIPQGFKALERILRKYYPQYNLIGYSSPQECMRAVEKGEADIMVEDSYVVKQWLQKPEFQSLQVLPRFSHPEGFCIAGVKGRDDILISVLNKSISMLEESYVEQSVIGNTVGKPYELSAEDFFYKYRYPFAIAMGTLMLTGLFLFLFFRQQKNYTSILKNKNEELKAALTLAEEADKAKGEFLSRMSHEMRTPLNAILGFSELTDTYREDKDKVHDYHKKIAIASELLLRIINDILDMSAIEQNKLKLEQAPVDMEELLEQIDTVYQEQCRAKGITYVRSSEGLEGLSLTGDSLRLSQILLNLLSNAVKFTPTGGKIQVTVREEILNEQNLKLFLTVQDNGIGMSEEMRKRVFQPFEQENGSVARQYGGSGLGLSIAKSLVEMMQGTIQVESSKSQGTAFYLEIPFRYEKASAGVHKDVTAEVGINDFTGKRFLMAEDNKMNAEIAAEFLQTLGADVDWARNGREAAEMFQNAPAGTYSLILMDIQMPEIDGYTAAKIIRSSAHPQAHTIPIIAMTADAFQSDKEHARKAGMNAHLAKPIDFITLGRELSRWV